MASREYHRQAVKAWRERNPELNRERSRLYRSKRRATIAKARTMKYIQLHRICNWHSKVCGICDQFIEGDYHVDHIIPLSRGGEHSLENLQLAHPFCNRSKFTKLTDELLMVN